MIMSNIMHVFGSHSLAVDTEDKVCRDHNYKSRRYQVHETMEQCKSILLASVKSKLAFTSG